VKPFLCLYIRIDRVPVVFVKCFSSLLLFSFLCHFFVPSIHVHKYVENFIVRNKRMK